MPTLSIIVLVVLAWVLLSLLIAVVVFVIPKPLHPGDEEFRAARGGDRRAPGRDRRIGLPDLRPVRTERRTGTDRRRGHVAT
jgi:hypothetical protein